MPIFVDLEDVEPTLVDLDDWSDNSLESFISLICRRGGRVDSRNRGKYNASSGRHAGADTQI